MPRKKKFIRSVFLDLDGPLLDVSERYYRAYRNIIVTKGGEPLSKSVYWHQKRKAAPLAAILGSSKSKISQQDFLKLWMPEIERKSNLKYDKLRKNSYNCLLKLKKRARVFLVTLRQSRKNLLWQLKSLKLSRYFDKVLCGHKAKSAWQVKYGLIKKSGWLTPDSWLIGDSEVDMQAGRKLKINTIGISSGIREGFILKKYHPTYLRRSLAEVPEVIDCKNASAGI